MTDLFFIVIYRKQRTVLNFELQKNISIFFTVKFWQP